MGRRRTEHSETAVLVRMSRALKEELSREASQRDVSISDVIRERLERGRGYGGMVAVKSKPVQMRVTRGGVELFVVTDSGEAVPVAVSVVPVSSSGERGPAAVAMVPATDQPSLFELELTEKSEQVARLLATQGEEMRRTVRSRN